MLVETHAHLDYADFANDFGDVFRAQKARGDEVDHDRDFAGEQPADAAFPRTKGILQFGVASSRGTAR